MKHYRLYLCTVILFMSLSSGCAQALYSQGQSWQMEQCSAIPDQHESKDCQGKANLSYEDYIKMIGQP